MKKLLLLGGSAQQVVAIETAKRLGYYTVLCDVLPDNPGQYAADKFYLTSTTDQEAILQVAKEEKIDGIVAYASDPAAPTAAYVAEKLELPGNPYTSVEVLCNKDKFRKVLQENGFCTPLARSYQDPAEAKERIRSEGFCLPVILKPVDSSGSKGATVLRSWDGLRDAVDFAFSFSRCKRIVVEEFIEKKHPYLIGGDLFIADGKIVMWGLMNCHRDNKVNPLVPVGKSYPLQLRQKDRNNVHKVLQDMVDQLHIRFGAMNVELVVDHNDRVFPIDVGPRNGGNMIPDLLGLIFGVDVVEMTIQAAMGQMEIPEICQGTQYYATHNLHSAQSGIFQDVKFDPCLEPYMIRKCIYKKPGDSVEYFDNAAKALGIVFFKFDSQETMTNILQNIEKHIHIILA